jgi:catechol 2,3-dioxygenase-like lactoylglutathione lyase family enzyme
MIPATPDGDPAMPLPSLVILYVDSPARSAEFYGALLGRTPVESSATFAMFALDHGLMLGLWSRHTVEPAAMAAGGGGELAFPVESQDAVLAVHAEWTERGIPTAQPPCAMDFGFTFVGLDPDGHRLRVFAPDAA